MIRMSEVTRGNHWLLANDGYFENVQDFQVNALNIAMARHFTGIESENGNYI